MMDTYDNNSEVNHNLIVEYFAKTYTQIKAAECGAEILMTKITRDNIHTNQKSLQYISMTFNNFSKHSYGKREKMQTLW